LESNVKADDAQQVETRGVLLDLDGTLWDDEYQAIPGAVEAVARLRRAGLAVRFGTNTTRFAREALVERLVSRGFEAHPEELLTAPLAARSLLERRGWRRIHLYVAESTYQDFSGFELDGPQPEAVVVGDLGSAWSFERLNTAFRTLLEGAELVAVQKNRYWKTEGGFCLDAGAFVAALEFASGKSALLAGKPSPAFFEASAGSMGIELASLVAVGDDVTSDIHGARSAGARAVLVRTGKFKPSDLETCPSPPSAVIDSVADLPELLAG
jgi:HAD superfamily hydrolase (TIGR01458 family)